MVIGNNFTFILFLLLGKVIGLTSCFLFMVYSIFLFLSLNVTNKPVLFIVYCLLRVEHYTCMLVLLQQSTGNTSEVSDLTYLLSGAASKVSLSNYYGFCLVLLLL